MPERQYFSLRFAIPGYTLILLVIGINHVPLLRILQTTDMGSVFGAFLAFLSLLTGSALGFLVSQFWWWIHERKGAHFGIDVLVRKGGPLRILIDELGLVDLRKQKPKKMTPKKMEILAIYDYISAKVAEEDKDLGARSTRRWDMYHLLSCTKYALSIGCLVGIFCRLYFEVFLFDGFLQMHKGVLGEFFAQLFILILVFILAFLLCRGRQQIITYYADLSKIRLKRFFSEMEEKDVDEVKNDLKEIFPCIFE